MLSCKAKRTIHSYTPISARLRQNTVNIGLPAYFKRPLKQIPLNVADLHRYEIRILGVTFQKPQVSGINIYSVCTSDGN